MQHDESLYVHDQGDLRLCSLAVIATKLVILLPPMWLSDTPQIPATFSSTALETPTTTSLPLRASLASSWWLDRSSTVCRLLPGM
jgi:hypothetical protein